MKKHILFLFSLAFLTVTSSLIAQGTAFTYQGRLQTSGGPASGNYDFTLALFNTNSASSGQVGGTLTNLDVGVTNGLFALTPDFGASFTGNATWLAIGVRTNGGSQFTALTPLQELTPTPYAIFAGAVNAAGLSGTIAAANIANGTITSNLLAAGAVGSNQLASSIGLWTQTGNNLVYNQGSVGIGTTAPAAPLHVNSSGFPSALVDGSSIYGTWQVLRNTSAGGTNWQFISTGSGNGEGAGKLLLNCGATPGAVTARILTVQPNGNVGIGTVSPAAPLAVQGNGATSSGAIYGVQTTGSEKGAAIYGLSLVPGGAGVIGEADASANDGSFPAGVAASSSGTNGAALYAVASAATGPTKAVYAVDTSPQGYAGYFQGNGYFSGNVGIGTTTPANGLEVAGTAQFDGYVGIGTATPAAPLHVSSSGFPSALVDGSSVYGTWNVLRNTSAGGTNWQFIATGSGNGEGPGKLLFNCGLAPTAVSANILTLQPNGNVGIGTTGPTAPLQVQGNGPDGSGVILGIQTTGGVNGTGLYGLSLVPGGNGVIGEANFSTNNGSFPVGVAGTSSATNGVGVYAKTSATNGPTMAVYALNASPQGYAGYFQGNGYFSGNVGIGTSTPGKAALEVDGAATYFLPGGQGFNAASGGVAPYGSQSVSLSIYAAGGMASADFFAFSDERIKHIHGRSDAARDLATLMGIEVTDYSFIDTAARGTGAQKKVIAQQVEKIYPQAVRQSTDVVPDIYQQATVRDGWVQLATPLKVGERVKLVSGKEQGVYEVTAVRDGAFRTTFNPASATVFVYGREVNDFRTVDYDAIAMLNVSATQELARKVEAQSAELARLQSQLAQALTEKDLLLRHFANLEARDQALDARLARIENSVGPDPARLAQAR